MTECLLTSIVLGLLLCKYQVPRMSPDGEFYWNRPNLRPYCTRKLLTLVLGRNFRLWRVVSAVSVTLAAFLIGWKLGNPWVCALCLSLPVFRQAFAFPVLPDPVGLLFLSAGFYFQSWELCALGGLFCEKCPVFGAFVTHPLALLGLIPGLLLLSKGERPQEGDPEWLRTPFKAAFWKIGRVLDPKVGIYPWGGAVLGFSALSPQGWGSVLVGYGQLLVAQDASRLFTWSFLPLMTALPPDLAPIACLIGWANPHRDDI